MAAIGLYVIHDYRLPTEVLLRSLAKEPEVRLLGSADDLDRALEELSALPVDLVLIDATGNRSRVLEGILELRDELSSPKILPLGVRSEEDVVALLEAGADGYLLREASFSDLLNTIETVHHGKPFCSPAVIAAVASRIVALAAQSHRPNHRVTLTRRETEILELIASGQRNKEIASRLNISLATVKNHVHRILDKLEVKGRHDAIRQAYERGLLTGRRPGRSAPAR